MAKNLMRRALWAVVDPLPTDSEVEGLWSYFDSCCAYCGVRVDRGARGGHLDHLKPSAAGGTNEVFNHVLSCPRCNGDDKRDEPWDKFRFDKPLNFYGALVKFRGAYVAAAAPGAIKFRESKKFKGKLDVTLDPFRIGFGEDIGEEPALTQPDS